jgi:hypothetical protein
MPFATLRSEGAAAFRGGRAAHESIESILFSEGTPCTPHERSAHQRFLMSHAYASIQIDPCDVNQNDQESLQLSRLFQKWDSLCDPNDELASKKIESADLADLKLVATAGSF